MISHGYVMPVRKSHPYAKGCDEPQAVTDAREAAMIFDGLDMHSQETLQTYLLAVAAGLATPGLSNPDDPFGLFSEATTFSGGTITDGRIRSNGGYRVPAGSGRYTFAALGNFGGGTLTVRFSDGTDFAVFIEDSNPLTANGGFSFDLPTEYVEFSLAGATNPNIKIYLKRLP